jgi:CrcB protein
VKFLLVAIAGAAGAVTRYGINRAVGVRSFPWATLAINLTGSFVLALVLTAATARRWSPELTTAVTVGFLGAYTTFSTFTFEALSLERTDRLLWAIAYVVVSVAVGLLAAAAGVSAGRALTH